MKGEWTGELLLQVRREPCFVACQDFGAPEFCGDLEILTIRASPSQLAEPGSPRNNMAARNKRRRLSLDGTYEDTLVNRDSPANHEQPSPQSDQRRSLFVRSLPATVTTERLTEHFSQSYPLKHATVVLDPQTKVSKGYGFVTFADPEDAHAAHAELNDSVLDGRKIKVEIAEPRHREKTEDKGQTTAPNKGAKLGAEREKAKLETLPPKLIVRNLPWSVKEPEDLALLFRSYGKVKHAIVPRRSPKVQSGFGFVVLRGRKNSEKAIAGVNGKKVDGRTLAVDWAVDKATWENLNQGQNVDNGGEEQAPKDTQEGLHSADNHEGEIEGEVTDEEGQNGMNGSDEDDSMANGEDYSAVEHDRSVEEEKISNETESEDQPNNTTIFVRNLPFACTDETLGDHFSRLGSVRYARVVYDHETERSKGTGFVCFFSEDDAKSCVKNAPKPETPTSALTTDKKRRGETIVHSVLQNEAVDPTGQYTLDSRVLQVSRALNRTEASRREAEGSSKRDLRDRDKRRLYLLSEGTIPRGSKLYENLGPTEINIREASAKQRQKLIKSNPSLHLSLTRLSVRNVPRSVSSKDLKALAREAVVGFATDVKSGLRQSLSKEELARGGPSMREAEKLRKQHGTGIVKQAKIVFEGREGAKISEKSGAGRSRGYGFVEYVSHRNALMGLRWLNGHAVKSSNDEVGDRTKRLIVEFAIENAQVVTRRREREVKERTGALRPRNVNQAKRGEVKMKTRNNEPSPKVRSRKRKRADESERLEKNESAPTEPVNEDEKNRRAKRNRIISKKRMMRKSRKAR